MQGERHKSCHNHATILGLFRKELTQPMALSVLGKQTGAATLCLQ